MSNTLTNLFVLLFFFYLIIRGFCGLTDDIRRLLSRTKGVKKNVRYIEPVRHDPDERPTDSEVD